LCETHSLLILIPVYYCLREIYENTYSCSVTVVFGKKRIPLQGHDGTKIDFAYNFSYFKEQNFKDSFATRESVSSHPQKNHNLMSIFFQTTKHTHTQILSLTEKVNFQFSVAKRFEGGKSFFFPLCYTNNNRSSIKVFSLARSLHEAFTVIFSKMNSLLCGGRLLNVWWWRGEKTFSLPFSY
jgi:hypothetical protein